MVKWLHLKLDGFIVAQKREVSAPRSLVERINICTVLQSGGYYIVAQHARGAVIQSTQFTHDHVDDTLPVNPASHPHIIPIQCISHITCNSTQHTVDCNAKPNMHPRAPDVPNKTVIKPRRTTMCNAPSIVACLCYIMHIFQTPHGRGALIMVLLPFGRRHGSTDQRGAE